MERTRFGAEETEPAVYAGGITEAESPRFVHYHGCADFWLGDQIATSLRGGDGLQGAPCFICHEQRGTRFPVTL